MLAPPLINAQHIEIKSYHVGQNVKRNPKKNNRSEITYQNLSFLRFKLLFVFEAHGGIGFQHMRPPQPVYFFISQIL